MSDQYSYEELIQRIAKLEEQNKNLQAEAIKYRTLFDSFPHGISVSDSDGNVVEANSISEQLLGINKKDHKKREISGKEWRIIGKDGSDMPVNEWASVIALKENRLVNDCEMGIVKPDSQITWINVTAAPIPLEGFGVVITYNDITEKINTQKELRESEKRYKKIFNNKHVPMLVIDPETGSIIDTNPASTALYGWSFNKLTKMNIKDINTLPSDDVISAMQKTIKEGGKLFHFQHRLKDGSIRDMEVASAPVEYGKKINLFSIVFDITERQTTENELRRATDRLLQAQRIAEVGDWEWDPDTDTVTWSEQLYRIFELDPNQPPPEYQRQLDLYHPEDAVRLNKAVTSALEQGTPYELEMCRTTSVGRVIHLLVRGVVDRDESSKVLRLYGSVQDITTRKQVEDDLREGRAMLKAALDSMSDAVFISNANGRFIEFNEAFATFHRFRDKKDCLEDLADWSNILNVYLPDDTIVHLDMWAVSRALRGETATNSEYRLQRRDTGETWFGSYNFSPILNEAEEIVGSVVVARDITEQRKLQAQLQQAQKMESIGNLAGGIAHDFNNILSSIIGFTELAIEGVPKGSSLDDSLQEVYSAGKRARDLVKQILAFARQSDEKRSPIQPSIIAKEVLQFIRSTIPTTIEIQQDAECDSLIFGNATQLHQVLMNLCTNSAHAMEESGGVLAVSLKDVIIDKEKLSIGMKPGNYIEITVSDTGVGIAPEIIGSIFDPYFTTKKSGEGTGLGLAMTYGIIESYGGRITVDSQLGKGTTFTINLPVTRKRTAHGTYAPEQLPTGTERILFVDDEAPIAKMGSQILEHLGYSVRTRTSSIEALKLFQAKFNDFDLVVTDMTMPNLTGDKLAVELIKIRPDIPVILCTGYSKKISDEIASEIGIKAFAYKPMLKADLAKTVRKVLDEAKS